MNKEDYIELKPTKEDAEKYCKLGEGVERLDRQA